MFELIHNLFQRTIGFSTERKIVSPIQAYNLPVAKCKIFEV